MKKYPNKVYLSTSWHDSDKPLSSFIVNLLMKFDLTIVGDHPEYQKDDPFERAWTSRILKLVSDCSALIIVFPKRDEEQTTSPYMFPELLAAEAQGIPILVFNYQGVVIKKTLTKQGFNLHFGTTKKHDALTYKELFIEYNGNKDIDTRLGAFSTLKLEKTKCIDGPYELLNNNYNYEEIISNFVTYKVKRVDGAFVFNVLPFSLKDKEHIEISKAVFEETGLPCHISLDSIGESQRMREQWRESLSKSEFVVAEFSQLRDTCLFEVGVVMGMDKKLFLLAKKEPKLPYGLDDTPLILYKSMNELKEVVKGTCKEYKRKVYNFDKDITASVDKEYKNGGIPEWFYQESRSIGAITKLTVSSWVVSIAIALLIWSSFVIFGATDSPATFLGLVLSFIFGISSHFRPIRSWFESKYIDYANNLIWISSTLFILSVIAVTYAYFPKILSFPP